MGEVWKYLAGGGAVVLLTTIGAGIKYLMDGAATKENDAKKQIQDWQRQTVRRADWEAKQHDWWRNWAGRLEHVITIKLGEKDLPKRHPYPIEPRDDDSKAKE